jgi:hypothetical protein
MNESCKYPAAALGPAISLRHCLVQGLKVCRWGMMEEFCS